MEISEQRQGVILLRSIPFRLIPGLDRDARVIAGVCLAVCCLATGGIFVKMSALDPIATGMWRIALSMPLVALWCKVETRSRPASRSDLSPRQKAMLWLAGMFLGFDLALWNISFSYTTVANANLLANLVPFIVIPVAFFVFKERFSPAFLKGLALAVCGVLLLLWNKLWGGQGGGLFGDALAAATAVFYGLYILVISRIRQNVSSSRSMYFSGLGCLSVLIPIALCFETRLVPATLRDVAPLVGLAVISHVGGQGLLALCLRYVPPGLSSVLVLLQPVVAALYAWGLFGERLGALEACGIVVCLSGLYLAKRSKTS